MRSAIIGSIRAARLAGSTPPGLTGDRLPAVEMLVEEPHHLHGRPDPVRRFPPAVAFVREENAERRQFMKRAVAGDTAPAG
jgi:hypothetical protein